MQDMKQNINPLTFNDHTFQIYFLNMSGHCSPNNSNTHSKNNLTIPFAQTHKKFSATIFSPNFPRYSPLLSVPIAARAGALNNKRSTRISTTAANLFKLLCIYYKLSFVLERPTLCLPCLARVVLHFSQFVFVF